MAKQQQQGHKKKAIATGSGKGHVGKKGVKVAAKTTMKPGQKKPTAKPGQKPQAVKPAVKQPQAQKPQKQQGQNNNKRKAGGVTAGSGYVAKKVVVKTPKIEIIPEDATLEDFRIVAGTYENVLYGVDAFWTEDRKLNLSPVFAFSAHIGCIKALAIGGHFLASGSTDEKIQLYDLKRRKELGALMQHQGTITTLSFHGKSHMLSGSEDGKILVWRSKDWECLKSMKGHQAAIHSIAIHPSGKIALSVSVDHSVRVWNLLLGKQASMTRLPGEGLEVAWNPSGTGYSIMFDGEVGVYELATAKRTVTMTPARKTRFNTMVYYTDDYVVVGAEDKQVRIYRVSDGVLMQTLSGHQTRLKDMDIVSVPFTPNQKSNKGLMGPDTEIVDVLSTVSSDGMINVWDLQAAVSSKDPVKPLGTFNTDMRVTCLSAQKGIWKNVGVVVEQTEEDSSEDEGESPVKDQISEDDDEEDEDSDEPEDEEEEEDTRSRKKAKTTSKK